MLEGRIGPCVCSHQYAHLAPMQAFPIRFSAMLQGALPRTVSVGRSLSWYVYTDASYNAESADWPCGLGGTLLNPAGRLVAAFSALVPEWLRQLLGESSKKTIFLRPSLWRSFAPCVCGNTSYKGSLSCSSLTITARGTWPYLEQPDLQ